MPLGSSETNFQKGRFLLTGAAITTANGTSAGFVVGQADTLGVHVVIANTDLVGALEIQGTIDGSSWVSIPFYDGASTVTSISVASGAAKNLLLTIDPCIESQVRVKWTHTSGSNANNSIDIRALQKRAS